MNGFIKRTMAVLCVGGAATISGCAHDCRLCDLYDNCWPERYTVVSNAAVQQTFAGQVANGHVLDQTIFTYHFEPGKDVLTRGGQEYLAYLARRRPQPDCTIYLQTAQDVKYDATAPEQYAKDRADLDAARHLAIQRFLNAETAGRPVQFTVVLHDAPTPGVAADAIGRTVPRHYSNFQGAMSSIGAVGGAPGGSGNAAPASTPR